LFWIARRRDLIPYRGFRRLDAGGPVQQRLAAQVIGDGAGLLFQGADGVGIVRPYADPMQLVLLAASSALIVWLALAGLLMAIGTLSVIGWAEQEHGLDIARTAVLQERAPEGR